MPRPPVPAPIRKLAEELFPKCVRCGTTDNLQLSHIGDLPQIRALVHDDRLAPQAEAEWQAAMWNHPGNVTRLCQECEGAYNTQAFTPDDLRALRQAAAANQGVRPVARFFRRESLNVAPTHRGDVLAILYALDEMSRAHARGEWPSVWPTVFVLRGGRAHGNYHEHVNVPLAETRICSDDLPTCLSTTPPWEWWR